MRARYWMAVAAVLAAAAVAGCGGRRGGGGGDAGDGGEVQEAGADVPIDVTPDLPADIAPDRPADVTPDLPADVAPDLPCPTHETFCSNGIDDDCDGLTDCADPDCVCPRPVGPGDLVINEVLADPPPGADVNCDGLYDSSADEFIEALNVSGSPLTLDGATYADTVGTRHTMTGVLPPGGVWVLFGSGSPACAQFSRAGTVIETSTTGLVGLNNAGDSVTLRSAAGLTIASMSYGAEGGFDTSLTLNPDGFAPGGYVAHSSLPAGLSFSPGLRNDGTTF